MPSQEAVGRLAVCLQLPVVLGQIRVKLHGTIWEFHYYNNMFHFKN